MRQEEHGYRINWKNQFWKFGAYGPFRVVGHIIYVLIKKKKINSYFK